MRNAKPTFRFNAFQIRTAWGLMMILSAYATQIKYGMVLVVVNYNWFFSFFVYLLIKIFSFKLTWTVRIIAIPVMKILNVT